VAHVNRKQYWQIFFVLFVLTVVEVGVAYLQTSWGLIVSALVLLAIAKAGIVGLYYMHLNHETQVLKLTVAIPMAIPFLYAAVLIIEGASRALF
jgi:caa(3)-type oxidase subunit IV